MQQRENHAKSNAKGAGKGREQTSLLASCKGTSSAPKPKTLTSLRDAFEKLDREALWKQLQPHEMTQRKEHVSAVVAIIGKENVRTNTAAKVFDEETVTGDILRLVDETNRSDASTIFSSAERDEPPTAVGREFSIWCLVEEHVSL